MVTGTMPRLPRWEYRSGRSAMRQMLAASSRISDHGRVEPPAGLLGAAPPGAQRGVGEPGDQRGGRRPGFGQQVQRVAGDRRTRPGRTPAAGVPRGGVTQAMISSSCRHLAAVRAVW